jgi:anti-sigma factor RsiW
MNCDDVRPQLLDYQRGRLSARLQEDVRAHLQGCSACEHEIAAEALLTEVLEHRLPQHGAPLALKRQLARQWQLSARLQPSWWARRGRPLVPALATAAVLLIAIPIYYQQAGRSQNGGSAGMVTEAVTDHLRLLASQHPLDVESGDMHQVKPWYEGRLDFAPVVPFLGDQEFPLAGGPSAISSIARPPSSSFIGDCTRSRSSYSRSAASPGLHAASMSWVRSERTRPTIAGST